MRTLIKGGWVVGYGAKGHELLADGVVVFEDSRIVFVGHEWSGAAPDKVIDARGRLVSPGFIDSHVHMGHRSLHRLMSDTGRPEYLGQPFYETALKRPGANGDGRSALGDLALQSRYTVVELLRNGITSFVEFGSNRDVHLALAAECERFGIRAWLGVGYESYRWVCDDAGRRHRIDHEEKGFAELDVALRFIAELEQKQPGRVQGLLVPRDADTCSPELLKRTAAIAAERNLAVAIHAAYNPWEFSEVVARHGCTPLELLQRCGLLGPRTMLGHCNFPAQDGTMHYPGGRDLDLLSGSGAVVSHCPVNLVRRGRVLDHWARYRDHGIPIALGTDTYPRDMMMQMRAATYMAKAVSRDLFAAPANEVFDAATVITADFLKRKDLGRLAPDAVADIVIVDIGPGSMRYRPVRDPIRALVECGIGEDVETVIVDGVTRVENRRVLGVDLQELQAQTQEDAESQWAGVADWDPLGRSADERSPYTYPLRKPS